MNFDVKNFAYAIQKRSDAGGQSVASLVSEGGHMTERVEQIVGRNIAWWRWAERHAQTSGHHCACVMSGLGVVSFELTRSSTE